GLTCQCVITSLPTDLAAPDETMKLEHSTAPNTSDVRLPSMNPKTRPQIMPSDRPLRNMAATFQGAGTSANKIKATHDSRIRTTIAAARLAGSSSETTLIPITLA